MCKVLLTITESKCRSGYVKKGDKFVVDDICPPLCHELWNSIYPSVYALKNETSKVFENVGWKVVFSQSVESGDPLVGVSLFDNQVLLGITEGYVKEDKIYWLWSRIIYYSSERMYI